MFENRYAQFYASDNDLCLPVVNKNIIQQLPLRVELIVTKVLGPGPRPQFLLDLEHLQIADYCAFPDISDAQRHYISVLHAENPIRSEEMIFLALRALFQFVWPEPTSEDDIRFAAAYDFELDKFLVPLALNLANEFKESGAKLPYWGRMSFLNVISRIPEVNLSRFGLGNVACALIKSRKFNARTYALPDAPLIAMNYALQPVLKRLNTYLFHYFCTRDMSGPKRLQRAWEGIIPIILHFWSNISANLITRSTTTLYGQEMGTNVHSVTADQVEYILMHELGHVVYDHPRKLKAKHDGGQNTTDLRHEYEFAADIFALGLLRSRLIKDLRAVGSSEKETGTEGQTQERFTEDVHQYQKALGSVYLLFTYMDFIQRAGEMLRDRVGSHFRFEDRLDTHPAARDRLRNLELANAGEFLYTSPIQRYAQEFLESVLVYANGLTDEELMQSVSKAGS